LPAAFLVVDSGSLPAAGSHGDQYRTAADNTIVLEDRRVSASTASSVPVWAIVLYDLASRGGTFVNNLRVSECA